MEWVTAVLAVLVTLMIPQIRCLWIQLGSNLWIQLVDKCWYCGVRNHSTGEHHRPDCSRFGCDYCGIRDHSTGEHHRPDCPRFGCDYCGIGGNLETVRAHGSRHSESCPRNAQEKCEICDIRGCSRWFDHGFRCGFYEAYVQKDGTHHEVACPRHVFHCQAVFSRGISVMCRSGGCEVVHKDSLALDHKATIWNVGSEMPELYSRQAIEVHRLVFCQDSISTKFRDGSSVYDRRTGGHPGVLACFHSDAYGERLFVLNNRTLFNAIENKIDKLVVTIVEKPSDWTHRFTGRRPWLCIKVRRPQEQILSLSVPFVKIPADAVPSVVPPSRVLVVLEARNLVNPKKDNLYSLIKEFSPELNIQEFEGVRAYARVRVAEEDEPLVRCVLKAIAKSLGKRPNAVDCFEVEGERRFESPRD